MAAEILSSFLTVLIEKFATQITHDIQLQLGVNDELSKLHRKLEWIKAVLQDAETKKVPRTSKEMKLWIRNLKECAYDANAVLDKVATESRCRQLKMFPAVRESFSTLSIRRFVFQKDIATSIGKIMTKMMEIKAPQSLYGLPSGEEPQHGDASTSAVGDMTDVFGRETDKKIIKRLLFSHSSNEKSIAVIPILGMSGIGKTALARWVFRDGDVNMHFETKIWVHVPRGDLDARRLIKSIIESKENKEQPLLQLQPMQKILLDLLQGKRFLLVLDDMWIESRSIWEKLREPLKFESKGSKILITTQSRSVCELAETVPPHELDVLSDEDCFLLFAQYAFEDRVPHEYENLHSMGWEITRKCKGLPLAAKTVGIHLRDQTDPKYWESIMNKEIWELTDSNDIILQDVRLSYDYLPAHLKRCIAYCSIIPKNITFEKENLVQLWMAQDFIQTSKDERLEDKGSEYFRHLFNRSFFQISHEDCTTNQLMYVMHDHIQNLVKSVADEECCVMELREGSRVPEKTHHASLLCAQPSGSRNSQITSLSSNSKELINAAVSKTNRLYTLLLFGRPIEVHKELFQNLRSLRSLDLSNSHLHELPDSIGDLGHLRYLCLSNTDIERLHESVCKLFHLQSLILRNCYRLLKLPKNLRYLIHLRHLDLRLADESKPTTHVLRSMPPSIGELTSLQTLPRFVVSTRNKCGLDQLKDLINLHGQLCITNLHNVSNLLLAKAANLASKTYIDSLELRWGDSDTEDHRFEAKILENLQPHTDLKELRITSYRAPHFPTWVGNSSFSILVKVKLINCKNTQLPPLGQLPKLKELYIEGMDGVAQVDCSFCGHGDISGFPSLWKLQFERMANWETWSGNEGCMALQQLGKLVIKECPKFSQLNHNIPAQTKLEIE